MPLGLIAFAAACAFVGIGLYINIAEQPARLGLAPSAMMKEWTPSNRRGFILLSALALLAAILNYLSKDDDGGWHRLRVLKEFALWWRDAEDEDDAD